MTHETDEALEWLWQVTELDLPVGSVERRVAHESHVLHRAGIVFLVTAGREVYLTVRAASKIIFPARYDSSASFHVAYGESYEQAAHRESMEELGLEKPLTRIGTFRHRDLPENQFVAVFVMHHDGEPIALDASEASRGAFYPLAETERIVGERPCTPWLRDGLPLLSAWLLQSP